MTPASIDDRKTEFEHYMAGLLEGDVRVLSAVIEKLIEQNLAFYEIYVEFVKRGMYEVGVLWERDQIPVAVEHLAATATQVVLSELYLKQKRSQKNSREAIVACVPGELHDVGTMIVANLFEAKGWKAVLLGANTPALDMLKMIAQRTIKPDFLALSITLPANRPGLESTLELISSRTPDLTVLVGGQALNGSDDSRRYRDSLLPRYPAISSPNTLDEFQSYLIGCRKVQPL
jgi:methanogenic corrinoid protein MtbC1